MLVITPVLRVLVPRYTHTGDHTDVSVVGERLPTFSYHVQALTVTPRPMDRRVSLPVRELHQWLSFSVISPIFPSPSFCWFHLVVTESAGKLRGQIFHIVLVEQNVNCRSRPDVRSSLLGGGLKISLLGQFFSR